ncbi:MAG: hypothetical protein PHF86_03655 [Candidatus Nanoarchaeia archaeon]|nr:hypothetical protein [Candidatus Nanoarchaeia archaeon]
MIQDLKGYEVPFDWKKLIVTGITALVAVGVISYYGHKYNSGDMEYKEGCNGMVINRSDYTQVHKPEQFLVGEYIKQGNNGYYDKITIRGEEIQDPERLEVLIKQLEEVRTCNTLK